MDLSQKNSLIIIASFLLFTIIIIKYYNNDSNNSDCELVTNDCNNYLVHKKILLSDLITNIKSGDLLLYSYSDVDSTNFGNRLFGHSRFPHIAIVIKINNKLFTCEMVANDKIEPGNPNFYTGMNIFPLETRICHYTGNVYIASLIKPLTNKQYNIFYNIIQNKKYKFSNKFNVALQFLSNTTEMSSNKRFCGELIVEIINSMKLLNKPIHAKKHMLTTAIIDLCDNITYTYPIHIICDKLIIKDINDLKDNYLTYC